MMFDVSIPIWPIITTAGLPAVLLLVIGLWLIRLKRRSKQRRMMRRSPEPSVGFDGRVHQQLLEQQIDAVFNTLITIIETERVKLKALVGYSVPSAEAAQTESLKYTTRYDDSPMESNHLIEPPDRSLGLSIAAMSKKGMTAEQIARRLGLSESELSLAVKMNNSRKAGVGGKMRAVA
jgi:hypothetical protein